MCICLWVGTCIWMQYLQRTEEGDRLPEAGVTDTCELWVGDSEAGTWSSVRASGALNH